MDVYFTDFTVRKLKHCMSVVRMFSFLAVLRSMVTATAFQILVSNNVPIKAITDNAITTLEVSIKLNRVIIQISVKPD